MSNGATPETWTTHFTAHPERGGHPLVPRFVGHHATCLAECFQPVLAAKPIAVLLMGPPASGKTIMLGPTLAARGIVPSLTIDADRYKEALPEYANGAGANIVHEESSWIASQARAVAIGRGCSFLNDAVGANVGKASALLRRLEQNGYEVVLACAYVEDLQVLLGRAHKRSRKVPDRVIEKAHKDIPNAFQRLCRVVSDVYLFNGADDGGKAWEKISGKAVVHDAAFLARLGWVLPA